MLTDANPMPAVTAKTNVIAHTLQPTSAVARRPACQSPAATDGITRATRSAATPTARNSHPAMSLDPSDRANQPFMAMPTPARANAAIDKKTGPTCRRDGATGSADGNSALGGGAAGAKNSGFAARNSSGISDVEDGGSASAGTAAFAFCCRLRGRGALGRSPAVLARFLGGT
jgi:hypothetical protein